MTFSTSKEDTIMIDSVGSMNDLTTGLTPLGGTGNGPEGSSNESQISELINLIAQLEQLMSQEQMNGGNSGEGTGMGNGGLGGGDQGGLGAGGMGAGGMNGGETGNLIQAGQPLMQKDADKALKDFAQKDPTQFSAFESALNQGDGSGAAMALTSAVNSGTVSKADGAALAAQINSTVSANGGQPVEGLAAAGLDKAVGANVLTNGAPGLVA
jgi:hypothetical protein